MHRTLSLLHPGALPNMHFSAAAAASATPPPTAAAASAATPPPTSATIDSTSTSIPTHTDQPQI